MERTSQLVLRNAAQIPEQGLWLINPPADLLFRSLSLERAEPNLLTQDYGDFQFLKQSGATVDFGVLPDQKALAQSPPKLIVLFHAREKERLGMMLNHAASVLPAEGILWLVGENQAGIKSAGKSLEPWFAESSRLDAARHCVLYRAARPAGSSFDLTGYQQKWLLGKPGEELRMVSLPGAFAHGRLDKGTELLLQVMESLTGNTRPRGKVLDFGCGIGVIGLSLAGKDPDLQMTLLDSSALALESARLSAEANQIEVDVMPSNGLQSVEQRFDWIVSNPPFHRGVRSNLDIAREFFRQAPGALNKQGKMLIVCNRHLPYESWLEEHFGRVENLAADNHFKVLRAIHPKN